jgi:hypothetical protein
MRTVGGGCADSLRRIILQPDEKGGKKSFIEGKEGKANKELGDHNLHTK